MPAAAPAPFPDPTPTPTFGAPVNPSSQPQSFAPQTSIAAAQRDASTLQSAFQPQQVSGSGWAEGSSHVQVQAASLVNGTKATWSTPYAIVSLVGKVIAVIALLMPCVSSPLLKAQLSSGGSSLFSILSNYTQASELQDIARGEWSMWSLNGLANSVNSLVSSLNKAWEAYGSSLGSGYASSGSNLEPLASLITTLATIVTIVWALMIVALVFTIVRPFVKNGRPAAPERRSGIDTAILVVVGLLCLAWCGIVTSVNGIIMSTLSSTLSSYNLPTVTLPNFLEVPLWPWVAAIASLLMAFWPRLSRRMGLSA